ncbi:hydroxyethylthiazole kinase [Lentilactobacillus kosonis]|uniref:hydroxyethylthiazole kinase n=1 Tax=Lentilactobacillus kosonis TaxID=2810561 RepID=A0A401FI85_9LACO|nr:hydroxyethylthiazole kinase [Lentilactobacillus kosonis]
MKINLLDELRNQNPIAFNISNFVTVQDVANGINAIGASPIMSEEKNEAEAMVKISNSLTVNLGAFTESQLDQIAAVTKFANQYHKPIVLDPVAVGAVKYRLDRCNELLDNMDVAVIRGTLVKLRLWLTLPGKLRELMLVKEMRILKQLPKR